MSTDEDRRKKLKGDIDRVDEWVITAADNGMFKILSKDNNPNSLDAIENILNDARENLDPTNPSKYSLSSCETNIAKAAGKYCDALYSTTWRWRFANIYGGHIWIYLTLFLLSSIFALYYYRIDTIILHKFGISESHSAYEIYLNGIMAVTWGAIGGIMRGIWFLKEHVDDRGLRNSWTVWFLSCPFVGGFFGAVVYFIVIAGLVSITVDDVDDVNFNNSLVIIAITVVAGFSWPAALEMIKRVVNSLAGTNKEQ